MSRTQGRRHAWHAALPAGQCERSRLWHVVAVAVLVAAGPRSASAQSNDDRFELGVQVAAAASSQFDRTDLGLGGRLSWYPVSLVGIEAELNAYPSEFPDGQPPFSRGRTEGLFGVTIGPRLDRVRPFVTVRPGFLRFREAPAPFPCILIFPPPLACALAAGRTVLAFDLGGGIQLPVEGRTFFRIDVGDRLVRYPGPVLDTSRTARQDPFWSHDLRFAVGGGLRF